LENFFLRAVEVTRRNPWSKGAAANGYKHLNKEVVVDAGDWTKKFGENTIVAGAALRGVFKASNVSVAQGQKVRLFWWHRMDALEQFLDDAKPWRVLDQVHPQRSWSSGSPAALLTSHVQRLMEAPYVVHHKKSTMRLWSDI
jgi:hypothetical protein